MYCCHLEGCLVFYLFIFLFISLGDFGWVKIKTTLFPIRLCNIVIFLLPPPSLLTCQFLIISLYTLLATTDHPPLVYPRKPGEIDAVTNILQGEFLSSPRAPPPSPPPPKLSWRRLISVLLPLKTRRNRGFRKNILRRFGTYFRIITESSSMCQKFKPSIICTNKLLNTFISRLMFSIHLILLTH